MRTFRYALVGAWAAAVIALLFCLAIGDSTVIDADSLRNVSVVTGGAAIVGLALGWLVAPRDRG
jgi:high-affinity Fe2+/Pb2+ permease